MRTVSAEADSGTIAKASHRRRRRAAIAIAPKAGLNERGILPGVSVGPESAHFNRLAASPGAWNYQGDESAQTVPGCQAGRRGHDAPPGRARARPPGGGDQGARRTLLPKGCADGF